MDQHVLLVGGGGGESRVLLHQNEEKMLLRLLLLLLLLIESVPFSCCDYSLAVRTFPNLPGIGSLENKFSPGSAECRARSRWPSRAIFTTVCLPPSTREILGCRRIGALSSHRPTVQDPSVGLLNLPTYYDWYRSIDRLSRWHRIASKRNETKRKNRI